MTWFQTFYAGRYILVSRTSTSVALCFVGGRGQFYSSPAENNQQTMFACRNEEVLQEMARGDGGQTVSKEPRGPIGFALRSKISSTHVFSLSPAGDALRHLVAASELQIVKAWHLVALARPPAMRYYFKSSPSRQARQNECRSTSTSSSSLLKEVLSIR